MPKKYITEIVREIWDDQTDECFCVRPDRDELRLVEVIYKSDMGDEESWEFNPGMAIEVANAMLLCAKEIKNRDNSKNVKV